MEGLNLQMNELTLHKTEAIRLKADIPQETVDYHNKIFSFMREISSIFQKWLASGKLEKMSGYDFYFNDNTPQLYGTESQAEKGRLNDGELHKVPEIKEVVEEFFGKEYYSSHLASILKEVGNRYTSYKVRNKEVAPNSPIEIRNKGLGWKSNVFSFPKEDESLVLIRGISGSRSNVNDYPINILSDHYDNFDIMPRGKKGAVKPTGGILSLKKEELILKQVRLVSVEKADLWVGVDINKNPMNFLAFSEDTKFGCKLVHKSEELKKIEKDMKDLQKEASNFKKYNSSQRSGLRKKQDKAHEQQRRFIRELVAEILQDFLERHGRFGLGLDTVTTGDKNGSFGQDKFIEEAQYWMIRNNLPWYPVPTPFTSKRCPECGNICRELAPKKGEEDKRARNGKTNIYKCHIKGCGLHEIGEHGDLVAAKTQAVFGKYLQDTNTPMTNTPDRNWEISTFNKLDEEFNLRAYGGLRSSLRKLRS